MQSVERKRPAILRFTVRLSPSLSLWSGGVVQNEKQRKEEEEEEPQDDDNDE